MKGAIIKSFKDEQLQQGSKFLQDLLPGHCSLGQMILDTVKNRSEQFKQYTKKKTRAIFWDGLFCPSKEKNVGEIAEILMRDTFLIIVRKKEYSKEHAHILNTTELRGKRNHLSKCKSKQKLLSFIHAACLAGIM